MLFSKFREASSNNWSPDEATMRGETIFRFTFEVQPECVS